jgi:acyl-coenzyme A thioesterase PaaI-like protein
VAEPLVHHDLCFGCGQANPFGLQLELERRSDGGVEGRFFVKQDHQGPPGYAHGGVMTAALDEAMALLLWADGGAARTASLAVELLAPVPIGTFVTVEAAVAEAHGREVHLEAVAAGDGGELLARATGRFVRPTERG